jgi:hypothetical protein
MTGAAFLTLTTLGLEAASHAEALGSADFHGSYTEGLDMCVRQPAGGRRPQW